MDYSRTELIILEALIKARNQTETEWLDIEKHCLDSTPTAHNENTIAIKEQMYNQLLQKTQKLIDEMKE